MPYETNRRVNVFELARRGDELEGELQTAAVPRLPNELRELVVRYRFSAAIDERGRPAATLTVAADLPLTCDLCGGEIVWSLRATRRYFFVTSEVALHALPIDVAEDEGLLGSEEFDLESLIEDDIILALPMAPRHAACQAEHEAAASTSRPEPDDGSARRKNPFATLATWSAGNGGPKGGERRNGERNKN